MKGTWVWSLKFLMWNQSLKNTSKLSPCATTTEPSCHNYWSPCALKCQSPAPAGPGVPKGWVASARKETNTQGRLSGRKGFFFFLFLGQLSFYRMNITSPLSHHILHQILVLCFHQYFSSPCFSPMYSSGTFPIIGFFPRMSHTLVFLPQWPNILTLTKTMFHRVQI